MEMCSSTLGYRVLLIASYLSQYQSLGLLLRMDVFFCLPLNFASWEIFGIKKTSGELIDGCW